MKENHLLYTLDLKDKSDWLIVSAHPLMHTMGMVVQETGDFYLKGYSMTERQGLSSFEIAQILSGEMELEFREKKYCIQEGDTLWIDCREYYRVVSQKDVNTIFVHFDYQAAIYYFEQFYELNGNSPRICLKDSRKIEKRIRQLIELYRGGDSLAKDFRAAEILFSIMTQLVLEVMPEPQEGHLCEHVLQMTRYMQEHYQEKITLDMLSEELHISKFHLSRLFRQAMGMTPGEYLTRLRINRAKLLLRQTGDSIAAICEQIGFENPSYFIRLFRRFENSTPGEYRRKWGNVI